MQESTARAIENNLAVRRAVEQVVATARLSRPKDTSKNYDAKHLEWISWCERRAFVDGSIVSEGNVLLYLQEMVVPRGSRKSKDGALLPLSAEVLEGHVKALVDLYSTQTTLQLNPNPHPRQQALKDYLKTHKRLRSKRKRLEYHDRGEGTVQDTYSTDELKRMSCYFLERRSSLDLRHRVDLLLGHAFMARGETTRKLQLPDLFCMELKNEGLTRCITAMAIIDQGKMNQFGRIKYAGCIRHKDVELCPIGALAMYFFWRFHVAMEPSPDVRERKNWYDRFVLKGKDVDKEISYGTQASGMKRAPRRLRGNEQEGAELT